MAAEYGQYVVPSDVINLGIGQPANDKLPLDQLRTVWGQLCERFEKKEACQYGALRGYPEFLRTLASFLSEEYAQRVNVDELFVTNGITHAVEMLYKLYGGKKTKIFVEDPTYFIILNLFRDFNYEAEFVMLPMEKDGVDLEALELELSHLENDETAFFYTIPVFHNPTGATLSHEKRLRLGALADKWAGKLLVIADEVYQMLYFDLAARPPKPMCYYSDRIVSLGTFSKIFAPGVRLGWIQTKNRGVLNKLDSSGYMDSSGGIAPLMSLQMELVIKNRSLQDYINTCRQFLKKGCEALCQELKIGKFTVPKGGYFLWITFPEQVKTTDFLEQSLEDNYRVKFHPGNKFSANGRCTNSLRLSFSCYSPSQLREGAQRLNQLIADKLHVSPVETNQIHVHLVGYRGRLGSKIQDQLKRMAISCSPVDRDMKLIPSGKKKKDIILDASSPKGTKMMLETLRANGWDHWPVIVGTTGDLPMMELKYHAKTAPVLIASNFSYGVPMISKWLRTINQEVWETSIHETHHLHKEDKISGTALRLQQQLVNPDEVVISSTREGEVFGIHTVTMETPDEKIELTHTAKNREIFAVGAMRYFDWIAQQNPGLYTELDFQTRDRPEIKYDKYSGSGNDFIIVESSELPVPNPEFTNWSEFALIHCTRKMDVGGDGLIVVSPSTQLGVTLVWHYFNSDGSLVEMCGNGSRCVAHWASRHLGVDSGTIENNFGFQQTYVVRKNQVAIQMPMPKFLDSPVFCHDQNYSWINVGVPHLVTTVNSVAELDPVTLESIVAEMRDRKIIANMNWVQRRTDDYVPIRTFERGSGHTLACGTGCCASALHLLTEDRVQMNPGSKYETNFLTDSQEVLTVIFQKEETPEGEKLICHLSGKVKLVSTGKIED